MSKLKTGHLISRNKAGAIISEALKVVSELEKINQEALQSIPEIEERYSDFFSNFGKIVPRIRNDILATIQQFPDSERENLLKYAHEIFLQNNGNSIGYIVEILNEWLMAGVTNLTEAMEIHDENYGPTYGVVPKDAEASPEFKNAMDLWKE